MRKLKIFLAIFFFGVMGVGFSLLSIVLLPLAMFVLIGLIGFLVYQVITYENENPSK